MDLTLEFGKDQGYSLGGASGGGDDVHSRCPGAAQVFMHRIEDPLVVGVSMDGRHQSFIHAKILMQYLDHRSDAVGSA